MKKNVVLFSQMPDDQKNRLAEAFNLSIYNASIDADKHSLKDILANADGIIGANMATKIDDDFLSKAPKLKAASTISVGFDNYDLSALKNAVFA